MAQDVLFLFLKSDNLIKVENLVKKSFADDLVINDATATMSLYKGTQKLLTANDTTQGDPVLIAAGDVVNKGSGKVGVTVVGNPFVAGDLVLLAGTTAYDGEKTLTAVTASPAVQEVQKIHPNAVATGGTYSLYYNGEMTSALAYNASTATVKSALEALTTIGAGGIASVYGDPLSVGDLNVTFAASFQDAAMLTINIASLTGVSSCAITQETQGQPAGVTSEIVFASLYTAETFAGTETVQNIYHGAVDRGSGLVGIPVDNHGLKAGDTVRIWGTKNYNGVYEVDSVTANEIQITETYVAENFDGTEYLFEAVPGAVDLSLTAEGTGGNYSGVIPETAEMTPDATYYLEISINKTTSDLLVRHTCKAVYFPREEI
jgi:hypothetical protein